MDCGLGECLGDPLDLAQGYNLFRLCSLLELCTVAGRRIDVAPRCWRHPVCSSVYVSKLEPAPGSPGKPGRNCLRRCPWPRAPENKLRVWRRFYDVPRLVLLRRDCRRSYLRRSIPMQHVWVCGIPSVSYHGLSLVGCLIDRIDPSMQHFSFIL